MRAPFLILLLFITAQFQAQINFTANDVVPPYTGDFGFGANMGYNPPWSDTQLADIAAGNEAEGIEGLGVTTMRPALPEHFLEQYGYDNKVDEFQHYTSIGLKDNVAFIGYPSDDHRDQTYYCDEGRSKLFDNMYLPIWDNGENGTPVNEENHYAIYLYKMVNLYKDHVKFWEVWNEPDFSYKGWYPPGKEGNFWENNPDPCDYALRAPIFHYNRLLRISYEVIKSLDPDSYVAIGGIGYPSFLDAVLRNTDNPEEGLPSDQYPLYGGAYFDVLSFHCYPHVDGSLREWNNDIDDFIYYRHSDAATRGVVQKKKELEDVLLDHNYNGNAYPEKLWIITEANVPRKGFDDKWGSEEGQVNFMIKTIVACQQNNILQYHTYNLGEKDDIEGATSGFQLMGLYKNLKSVEPYEQEVNQSGIAYHTTSKLLKGCVYDEAQTLAMALPQNTNGAAFLQDDGQFMYVLWAETQSDQTEEASALYSFPADFQLEAMKQWNWDYAMTNNEITILPDAIQLTGAPVFLRSKTEIVTTSVDEEVNDFEFNCFPNPFSEKFSISMFSTSIQQIMVQLFDQKGRIVFQQYETLTDGNNSIEVELEEQLPTGVYFLQTSGEDGTYTTKRVLAL